MPDVTLRVIDNFADDETVLEFDVFAGGDFVEDFGQFESVGSFEFDFMRELFDVREEFAVSVVGDEHDGAIPILVIHLLEV